MSFKLMVQALNTPVGNSLRKLVLIKLADHAKDNGFCFPSIENIAKTCEISKRSVIRHLQKLEEDGFIKVQRSYDKQNKKNDVNQYWLTISSGAFVSEVTESPTSGDNVSVRGDNKSKIDDTESPQSISESINESIIEPITTDKQENEQEPKKKTQPKKKKHDFPSDFAVTEAQQKKCDEYGINSQELVSQFDDFHSSKGNQFVDWSKAFNTWLNNHIKFEKLKPIAQGANYGQQQSELSHFDKLRAEAAAKYGNQQSESNAIRTVNQYDY